MTLGPNQQKWVDALRSGQYKQARFVLHSQILHNGENSYCCLGVACVIAEQNGVIVRRKFDEQLIGGSLYDQPDVLDWLKMKTIVGTYGYTDAKSLALCNDYEGMDFNQIADEIERNADTLFEAAV